MHKKRYIPKMSYSQTLKYCDLFVKLFLRKVSQKYKLIEITMPLVTEANSYLNNDCSNRKITFDNNIDYEVYELINNYDNLMRYNFFFADLNNDEILFSRIKIINRDKKIEPYETLESHFFSFEIFKKEEERNIETCFNIIEMFANWIDQTCFEINDFGIKHSFKKIKNIHASKISNLYPLLNDVQSIESYVKEKGLVAVSFDLKNFNKFFPFKSLISYDAQNTASLFVWCKQIDSLIEIMDVTFRPNSFVLDSQIKNKNSINKNNEFFNLVESDNVKPTMSIKLYIDKLFFYLLNKQNITELSSYNSRYTLEKDYLLYNLKNEKK